MTKTTVSIPPLSLPLSSNQTCNYSAGQHDSLWPTVKYDHPFGPYPFIAIPPRSMGLLDVAPPPSPPSPFPITAGHFNPLHLTPLNCHATKRQDEEYHWALSPCNELLSLLTLDRYPLELTSTNLFFFFFSSASYPTPTHWWPLHFKTTYTKLKYEVSPFTSCRCKHLCDGIIDRRWRLSVCMGMYRCNLRRVDCTVC